MKIYFAGSIRGGREDAELYAQIVAALSQYGIVLTEHVALKTLTSYGQTDLTDAEIYQKDMAWLSEANVVVAEVTTPSLGVGYEIAKAESLGKKVICLYRAQEGKRLSAMLTGSPSLEIINYSQIDDLTSIFEKNLKG